MDCHAPAPAQHALRFESVIRAGEVVRCSKRSRPRRQRCGPPPDYYPKDEQFPVKAGYGLDRQNSAGFAIQQLPPALKNKSAGARWVAAVATERLEHLSRQQSEYLVQ